MSSAQIILVEDDEADARLFTRALRKSNAETRIDVLRDGQSAVDVLLDVNMAPHEVPKLIVLDIKLPRLLGFDVLRILRQNDRMKKVPVVMMSSSTQRSDIDRAYELGANGYISKPETYAKLSELVSHLSGYWLKFNASPN